MASIPETAACPICGGSSYRWGFLRTSEGNNYFRRGDRPLFEITTSDEPTVARLCLGCGNLQSFAKSFLDGH